jgi:hypothetical protein
MEEFQSKKYVYPIVENVFVPDGPILPICRRLRSCKNTEEHRFCISRLVVCEKLIHKLRYCIYTRYPVLFE